MEEEEAQIKMQPSLETQGISNLAVGEVEDLHFSETAVGINNQAAGEVSDIPSFENKEIKNPAGETTVIPSTETKGVSGPDGVTTSLPSSETKSEGIKNSAGETTFISSSETETKGIENPANIIIPSLEPSGIKTLAGNVTPILSSETGHIEILVGEVTPIPSSETEGIELPVGEVIPVPSSETTGFIKPDGKDKNWSSLETGGINDLAGQVTELPSSETKGINNQASEAKDLPSSGTEGIDNQVGEVTDLPSPETKGVNDSNNEIVVYTTPLPDSAPTPRKRGGSSGRSKNAGSSSHCTRSQVAPRWTVEETLVLLNEIASLDDDWFRSLSSFQRWKMISDNCITMDVARSSNQCKLRWTFLLCRYNKIRIWESNSAQTSGSYWSLKLAEKRQFGLPVTFNQEVYESMDAVIKAHNSRTAKAVKGTNSKVKHCVGLHNESKEDSDDDFKGMVEAETSDSDYHANLPAAKGQAEEAIGLLEAEMAAADIDSGSEEMEIEPTKVTNKEQEMANKLKVNAKGIHAILRGELPDNFNRGRGSVDLMKSNAVETELTKRQADELIKAFGVLVSTLDQYKELIKNGECDGSSLMNPMAS